MNVLLIGATGQIGYALSKALSQTSHQISVLVRDKKKLPFPKNVNILDAATFTPTTFQNALSGVDCVIYGVGLPEQFTFDEQLFQRINYDLLKIFLDVLKGSTVPRLVYISTYEVFQPIDGVIRESNPLAPETGLTPYFRIMNHAYQMVLNFAQEASQAITTIHPAAVYGGLNTGDGFTNFIENLLQRRYWRLPAIIEGRFPIVHADSLATAVVLALDRNGPFLVSDQMTSLPEVALVVREYAPAFLPPTIPLWLAQGNTRLLEFIAKLTKRKPIMAQVQLEFLTKGWEPKSTRAQVELGWKPLDLNQGVQKYLSDRENFLA